MDRRAVKLGDLRLEPAEAAPFEPAGFDWSDINRIQARDPTQGHAIVPDAMVDSCSECCMAEVNGKPNVLGHMWRKYMTNPATGSVDCSRCPVAASSEKLQARDGNGNPVFRTLPDGRKIPLSQADVERMETDGTA